MMFKTFWNDFKQMWKERPVNTVLAFVPAFGVIIVILSAGLIFILSTLNTDFNNVDSKPAEYYDFLNDDVEICGTPRGMNSGPQC